MKYLALPFLVLIASQSVNAASPEDFLGKFMGSEDIEITCIKNPELNSKENRPWQADFTEVNGDEFKGETLSDRDNYNIKGKIVYDKAFGILEGKDKDGNICNAEFMGKLDGGELNINIIGSCPSIECKYKSSVEAKRQ